VTAHLSGVRTTHKFLALCEGLGHPCPLIFARAICATHAHSPSARSTGFCVIWVCISASSSRYQPPPQNSHRAQLLLTYGLREINHVVSLLRFWFHSHGLRYWGSVEFSVQCPPRNRPVRPPAAKAPRAKSENECKREAWPPYNTSLRDYKPVQCMLRPTVAPQK
jgi:hypothetical protein